MAISRIKNADKRCSVDWQLIKIVYYYQSIWVSNISQHHNNYFVKKVIGFACQNIHRKMVERYRTINTQETMF